MSIVSSLTRSMVLRLARTNIEGSNSSRGSMLDNFRLKATTHMHLDQGRSCNIQEKEDEEHVLPLVLLMLNVSPESKRIFSLTSTLYERNFGQLEHRNKASAHTHCLLSKRQLDTYQTITYAQYINIGK